MSDEQDKCPMCGAGLNDKWSLDQPYRIWTCGSFMYYKKYGWPKDCLTETKQCVRNQLAALRAKNKRLRSQHVFCEHCGGSWLDDGINEGCTCREIARLRGVVEKMQPKTVDGVPIVEGMAVWTTPCCGPRHDVVDFISTDIELVSPSNWSGDSADADRLWSSEEAAEAAREDVK